MPQPGKIASFPCIDHAGIKPMPFQKGGGRREKFPILRAIACHDFPRECRASSRFIAHEKICCDTASRFSTLAFKGW